MTTSSGSRRNQCGYSADARQYLKKPGVMRMPRQLGVYVYCNQTYSLLVYKRQGNTFQWEVDKILSTNGEDITDFCDALHALLSGCGSFVITGLTLYWHWHEGTLHSCLEQIGGRLITTTAVSYPFHARYLVPRLGSQSGKSCVVALVDIENWFDIEALSMLYNHVCKREEDAKYVDDFAAAATFYSHALSVLSQTVDELHGDCWQLTAASIGMSYYRRHFLEKGEMPANLPWGLWELERQAVYGGLTEVKMHGRVHGRWYFADANNLYHYIASNRLLPGLLRCYTSNPAKSEIDYAADTGLAVAEVIVNSPTLPLPKRCGLESVEWETGTMQTVLAGEELQFALRNNLVINVIQLATYQPAKSINKYAFVCLNRLAAAKHDRPRYGYRVLKRILTATYGKFAQVSHVLIPAFDVQPRAYFADWEDFNGDGKVVSFKALFGRTYKEVVSHPPPYGHPAVFACITAAARMWLRRIMNLLPAGTLAYVDTDCVVVNEWGLSMLEDAGLVGPEPGQLQIKEVTDELSIHAQKVYTLGGKRVAAGEHKPRLFPGVALEYRSLHIR